VPDTNFAGARYNKPMTNPDQPADNSHAKISEDSVEIFGQVFPLERHHLFRNYYPTGKLKSFDIPDTVINYKGKEIPVGAMIRLYEDGKFQGIMIDKEYIYEHKGQLFKIEGGLDFYPSGNLESFSVKEKTETDFIVDGKKLVVYKGERVTFYEESGLPKAIKLRIPSFFDVKEIKPGVFKGAEYNIIEISETGEITGRTIDRRYIIPEYD